jgi:hypothetical protein
MQVLRAWQFVNLSRSSRAVCIILLTPGNWDTLTEAILLLFRVKGVFLRF